MRRDILNLNESYRNLSLGNGSLYGSFPASAPPIGALTASLLASVVLHHYGRKIPLMVSMVGDMLAFLVLATSMFHESPEVMIGARIVLGMHVGMSMPAASIYVSAFWVYSPRVRKMWISNP